MADLERGPTLPNAEMSSSSSGRGSITSGGSAPSVNEHQPPTIEGPQVPRRVPSWGSVRPLRAFTFGEDRPSARNWALDYLFNNLENESGSKRLVEKAYGLSPEALSSRLLEIANKIYLSRDYSFVRFERLAAINVLHWQHKLMLLDEKLRYKNGEEIANGPECGDKEILEISECLNGYHAALENLHYTIFQHKQPDIIRVRDFGPNFARELEEPRYWDSPDAINLLDLQPKDGKYNADGLRQFLQKHSPEWLLDTAGKDERKLEKERKTLKISPGNAKILESSRHYDKEISPAVDRLARIGMSIIGGVLLLAPMIVLSFLVKSRTWSLVATSLFVVAFALILALSTHATNQELVASTAAYSAVLVVFVGVAQPGSST